MVLSKLRVPIFVKPANLGSSVGVSKVTTAAGLGTAIEAALRWDHLVVLEQGGKAREIECGVLGGDDPEASVPGEVVVASGFYDHAAKHTAGAVETVVPADIPPEVAGHVRRLAVEAFEIAGCRGMPGSTSSGTNAATGCT